MSIRFLAAAAASILAVPALTASALAADLPVRKSAPMMAASPIYNWTGFYVGLQGGWMGAGDDRFGWISSRVAMPSYRNLGNLAVQGGFGGLRLGYDWQAVGSPFVAGVVVDGNFDSAKRSRSGVTALGLAYYGRSNIDWDGSARLRLGYAFDRMMVYATGGLAVVHDKYRISSTLPLASGASASKTFLGGTAGVGVAYALTNNLSVGLEYRYTAVQSKGLTSPIVGGGRVHTVRSPSFHRVAATLDWRF